MRLKRKEFEMSLPGGDVLDLLRVVKQVLELRLVQTLKITAQKDSVSIHYERYLPETEAEAENDLHKINISSFTVDDAIRRSQIKEVPFKRGNGVEVICRCFTMATVDTVVPTCWATGTNSLLWKWLGKWTSISTELPQHEFFGIPIVQHARIPDEALVLLAGFERIISLQEVTHTYKIPLVLE